MKLMTKETLREMGLLPPEKWADDPLDTPINKPMEPAGWNTVKRAKRKKRKDTTIVCETCGQTFVFTVEEKIRYKTVGWSTPRHCSGCARARFQKKTFKKRNA